MSKKYVSMQEELAARKAAAGIDEPARATIDRKEPEKEALSAKFKGVLDKGTAKAKRQVRSRGQGGVPKIVEPKSVDADRDDAALFDQASDGEDPDLILEGLDESIGPEDSERDEEVWDDEGGLFLGEGRNKAVGSVIVSFVAMIVIAFAVVMFEGDVDYDEDGTSWTYDGLLELSADSTDEEVIECVDGELESVPVTDSETLNNWIRDTDIGRLMGKDIKYWNASAGDKYLRVNVLSNADEDYSTKCDDASSRLQDALMDDDLDETRVLFIVRDQENRYLLYVSLDSDGYFY